MGLAKNTFMAYVALKDSEPVSLEGLLKESYASVGWPEHYVSEDLERLAKEHIDNVDILKRVIEEGYSYKVQCSAFYDGLIDANPFYQY
jgi:hypothetical protein